MNNIDDDAIIAGQAVYSKSVLSIYDLWVLGFSNHCVWKCPTRIIGQQFSALTSDNHLDVGVGTGYYLKKYLPRTQRRLALMDLNENSLASAAKSVNYFSPEIYCQDVLSPLNIGCDKFNSISLNYLLHCLPGDLSQKSAVFSSLKTLMNDDSVLFGSTILGKGVPQNRLAKKLMSIYNQKGIFNNHYDTINDLERILADNFSEISVKLFGCVALFSGKIKK